MTSRGLDAVKPLSGASRSLSLFFLVFVLSGFSGLIYESIWSHYLKLFLGHAAYAQTLVLAIFMGGMALGAWLTARHSSRFRSGLRAYALAEALIGVAALLFHPVFVSVVDQAHRVAIPAIGDPLAVDLFKWSLGAALILPQSVLLGTTFPLMSTGLVRRFPQASGSTLAMLYFCNSLGGAVGILVSGFLLIKMLGLPGTLWLAGLLNLGIALVVWWLAGSEPEPVLEPRPRKDTAERDQRWMRFMLLVALGTGAASFIYEIAWIRMLSLVLGSSTHAFELMLSAFIFGLAFGGLWIRRRIDRLHTPERFLAVMQLVMGVSALATLFLYGGSFSLVSWAVRNLDKTEIGYLLFNLVSHGIAMAIMLPAAFCAGTTLPLITQALLKRGLGEGSIGRVYGANTIGAIVGVLAAVHLGMVLLGLKGLLMAGAAIDLLLGMALLWRLGPGSRAGFRLAVVVSGVALAVTGLVRHLDPHLMSSGAYRDGELLDEQVELRAYQDGKTATISLTEHSGALAIRTNGKVDGLIDVDPTKGPTHDARNMVLTGAIPLLLRPEANRAAVIGLGSGMTSHMMLSHSGLEQVDTVEIEQAIIDLARHFRPRNERVYSDPRSRLFVEDAKTFFSSRNARYDIIVSEPSNPWVSGVAGLFSQEFYQLVDRHLAPDGVLAQWLQLYEIDIDLVATVIKAISHEFQDYAFYATSAGDILVLASQQPLAALQSLETETAFWQEMRRIRINDLAEVEARYIGNRQLLSPLFERQEVPANSDFAPVLDQGAARARFFRATAQGLINLALEPLPLLEMLAGRPPPQPGAGISPAPLTQAIYRARLLHGMVTGQPLADPGYEQVIVSQARRQVNEALEACRNPPLGDRTYALFGLGLIAGAYLSIEETHSLWQGLEGMTCSLASDAPQRAWKSLLQAVGQRDAEGMARYSEYLLQQAERLTPARMRYLVAAAMLGHLGEGDKRAAARVAELLPTSTEQSLLLRLLRAHAQS